MRKGKIGWTDVKRRWEAEGRETRGRGGKELRGKGKRATTRE